MTDGGIVEPRIPLCHSRRPLLSFPQFLAGIQCLALLSLRAWNPAYPLCHSRRPLLSFPPVVSGNPVSCSSVLSCVEPRIPPLSFPQAPPVIPAVFSGNPVSFSSVLSCVGPPGNPLDSRLKTSGMTDGEIVEPHLPFCHSRIPPLSFPPVVSGNPVSCSSVPSCVRPRIPLLSFPPVVSGNPMSFSSVLSFVRPAWVEQFVEIVYDVRDAGLTNVSLAVERE